MQNAAAVGRPLDLDEIRRQLRNFRYDPTYHKFDERVSIRGIAELIGTSRGFLYALMDDGGLRFDPSVHMRRRLTFVINLINRGLRWRIRERKWVAYMLDGTAVEIPADMRPRPRNERADHLEA